MKKLTVVLLLILALASFAVAQTNHPLTLGTDEKAVVTPAPKTAQDTPAQLDGPNPQVVYSTSNPAVVTVSQFFNQGTITAVAPGTATVTVAATSEGTNVGETYTVTVESRKAVTLGLSVVISKK